MASRATTASRSDYKTTKKINFDIFAELNNKLINNVLERYDKTKLVNSEQLAYILNRTELKHQFYSTNFDLEVCKSLITIINNPNNMQREDQIKVDSIIEIYNLLQSYKDMFSHYDTTNCGLIDPHQLAVCITKLGYELTPATIKSVINYYSIPCYTSPYETATRPASKQHQHNHHQQQQQQQTDNDKQLSQNKLDDSSITASYDYINDNTTKIDGERHMKITFLQFVKCCVKLKLLTELFKQRDRIHNSGTCNFFYEEFIRLMTTL